METVDYMPRRTPSSLAFAPLLVSFVVVLSGCTLCQDCGDLDYPTYGGAWQRTRRDSGRVGSIFDPAGARSATLAARDSDREDSSIRTDVSGGSAASDDEAKRPDDPKEDSASGDQQDSPSDRSRGVDELRELDLNDINVMESDLEPPDA